MKKIFIIACVALMVAACGQKENREQLLSEIEAAELSMDYYDYSVLAIDSVQTEMINMYRKYYTAFFDDSVSAHFMMRSADMLINQERYDEALCVLDSIINLRPDYQDIGGCWFLKGLAFENSEQFDSARVAYTYFVDNYPDHYLAESTRNAIQYLGMTPEEMFDAIMNAANDQGLVMK